MKIWNGKRLPPGITIRVVNGYTFVYSAFGNTSEHHENRKTFSATHSSVEECIRLAIAWREEQLRLRPPIPHKERKKVHQARVGLTPRRVGNFDDVRMAAIQWLLDEEKKQFAISQKAAESGR